MTNSRTRSGNPAALGIATALLITANGIATSTAAGGDMPSDHAQNAASATSATPKPSTAAALDTAMSRVRSREIDEVERAFEDDQDEAQRAEDRDDRVDPLEAEPGGIERLPQRDADRDQQHDRGQLEPAPDDVDEIGEQQQPRGREDRRLGHAMSRYGSWILPPPSGPPEGSAPPCGITIDDDACRRISASSCIARSMPALAAPP